MRPSAWVVFVAGAAACGGGTTTPTTPTSSTGGSSPAIATITIGADGVVTPAAATIALGGRVTFVNSHSRSHDMSSDPHPDHGDCPEVNQVGFLQPGQSRTSGNFNIARTCGFHDHSDPTNSSLRGRITIQ